MPTESLVCASGPRPETMIMAESGTAPSSGRTIPPSEKKKIHIYYINPTGFQTFNKIFDSTLWECDTSSMILRFNLIPNLLKHCIVRKVIIEFNWVGLIETWNGKENTVSLLPFLLLERISLKMKNLNMYNFSLTNQRWRTAKIQQQLSTIYQKLNTDKFLEKDNV